MQATFVTLLTSDNYLPGALVLAKSLQKVKSRFPISILITKNQVSEAAAEILTPVFDKVIWVDAIYSNDQENLKLLGRPELGVTFTKIHCFNKKLLPFDRIAYLDADTFVLQNIDSCFDYVEEDAVVFAAAPDIGWPDCFNSGVFVAKPSNDLFERLMDFSSTRGSFDGGDQGLLNAFFSTWATDFGPNAKTRRLPFTFNVTPSTLYSYLPAFKQYEKDIRVVHFIGQSKPWIWNRSSDGKIIAKYCGLISHLASEQTLGLISAWWSVFDSYKVYELLNGMVLDRDWSRYSPPGTHHVHFESHVNLTTTSSLKLKTDFANYNLDWKESEVRPFKPSQSKRLSIPTIGPPKSPTKKTYPPNSIVFSTARPPSPTRQTHPPRSASPEQKEPKQSPVKEKKPAEPPVADINAMYVPGSVFTLNQTVSDATPFSQYSVDWNEQELQGKPPQNEKLVVAPLSPLSQRPVIQTDSFTISPTGVITYHQK